MKVTTGKTDEEIIKEATYLFKDVGLSFLQRRYGIGYARAAHILDAIKKMEREK